MNLSTAEIEAQKPCTDGRILRGAKTRTAIVEGLLDLFAQGNFAPTTKQIAEQAQTSVRSIFQHFEDIETLYSDLVAVQTQRVTPLVESLQSAGSLAERLAALEAQRAELFEQVTPARHALVGRPTNYPAITQRLRDLAAQLRTQLEIQFAEELNVSSDERAAVAVEALDLLWSFESWDRLRNVQELTVRQAQATLSAATLSILA
ncbi:MAG: TetR/AcrR family transcriptional regulator [Microthrixaceae bacterium]